MRSLSPRGKLIAWGVVFVLGAAFMTVQVGFWNHATGLELEDVNVYRMWSDSIASSGELPVEDSWQYPPGAAFLMLIPRIVGDFGKSFVGLMLAFYLAGTVLLAILARRRRNDTGVWVWLLAMPVLFTLPVLRFDLVPTVFAIAALVVISTRPVWFGALAGIGAMIKVWPIVVLFGEWDRRRLLVACGTAIAAAVLIFGVSAVAFGDQSGFLSHQDSRGLQVEAVSAAPWYLREAVTGEKPHSALRFGTNEIASGPADTLAGLLKWASLAVLLGAGVWWLVRSRAIRGGASALADDDLSRDFVFTVVLALVVTSRVLSPQYMIWLLGLAAVVLTAGSGRVARPAWIVVGAVILTACFHLHYDDPSNAPTDVAPSPANFVLRNAALLVAAIDAAIAMIAVLRRPQLEAVEPATGFSKT